MKKFIKTFTLPIILIMSLSFASCSGVLIATSNNTSTPDTTSAPAIGKINLEKAKIMIEACEKKAKEIGVPMVIAVVDEGGNFVAQHKMDDALIASIEISKAKAYTSVAFKMSTEDLGKLSLPDSELWGIDSFNSGEYIVFGGGFPIIEDGKVIGGIGVSGGSVAEDIKVATAGLSALK